MSKPFRLIMEEDRIIRGNYWSAKGNPSIGTLIICHGFKGFKDWGMFFHVAEELAEQLDVVLFNFSYNGVGENLLEFTELDKFAKETYSRDLEDLDALIGLVQSGKFKPSFEQKAVIEGEVEFQRENLKAANSLVASESLFLLGHSRGAGVALIHALDHPSDVAGVISWNGVTDVDLLTAENKEDMRTSGRGYTLNGRTGQKMPLDVEIMEDMERNHARFDIKKRISETTFPITLIQGTEDGKRLRDGSAQLVERNPDVIWTQIPGGNHTFGSVHPFQGKTEPLKQAIAATKQALQQMAQAKKSRI
jgi:pimeloyl-ACP methyl ester carboxylesterase